MATKLDHDPDEKAAPFLTDQDRLVFLLEELTRRLRRSFDSSLEHHFSFHFGESPASPALYRFTP